LGFDVIVVTPEASSDSIKDVIKDCGVTTFWTKSDRSIPGIDEAAAALKLGRILVVHGLTGVGLLPPVLVDQLVDKHVATAADLTFGAGLPLPLYAQVYERHALELVAEMSRRASVPDEPNAIVEGLFEICKQLPAEQRGISIQRVQLIDDQSRLSAGPGYIPWQHPDEVRRIDEVLSRSSYEERMCELREQIVVASESAYRRRRWRRLSTSRPLRILFASNPSAYSGAEECLVNSVRCLGSRIEPHALVALEGVFTERLRSVGVTVHCPKRDFEQASARNIIYVDDVLARLKPDLIHCNATVGAPLLGVSVVRRIPLLQWVRISEMRGFGEHIARADLITASSLFIADEVSKETVGAHKIRVLYDGVDCERFSPGRPPVRDIRREYNLRQDDRIILALSENS
jgi:glycosyltransferase involved in cell wall biosynthesis